MPKIPDEVKAGEVMDIGQLRALRDYVISLTPTQADGIEIEGSPAGTAYHVRGGGGVLSFPALATDYNAFDGSYGWKRQRFRDGDWEDVPGSIGRAFELNGVVHDPPFRVEVRRDPASGKWHFQLDRCPDCPDPEGDPE